MEAKLQYLSPWYNIFNGQSLWKEIQGDLYNWYCRVLAAKYLISRNPSGMSKSQISQVFDNPKYDKYCRNVGRYLPQLSENPLFSIERAV